MLAPAPNLARVPDMEATVAIIISALKRERADARLEKSYAALTAATDSLRVEVSRREPCP